MDARLLDVLHDAGDERVRAFGNAIDTFSDSDHAFSDANDAATKTNWASAVEPATLISVASLRRAPHIGTVACTSASASARTSA